jgi:hypothetical protein
MSCAAGPRRGPEQWGRRLAVIDPESAGMPRPPQGAR